MHEHSAAWMPLLRMGHKHGETNNQSINHATFIYKALSAPKAPQSALHGQRETNQFLRSKKAARKNSLVRRNPERTPTPQGAHLSWSTGRKKKHKMWWNRRRDGVRVAGWPEWVAVTIQDGGKHRTWQGEKEKDRFHQTCWNLKQRLTSWTNPCNSLLHVADHR